MRKLIQNYTFNKVLKQITFTDYVTIKLENIFLVTDVTNHTTIYQSNEVSLGGYVFGNVLTLDYDTNTAFFNNSDSLQIFYEEKGQKIMAESQSVVISSDQSPLPSSQSGTWNINNISGIISLPTGAATGTKQDTGNTSLSSIDGKLTTLNAKDFATSAKQDTANSTLSSIDTDLGFQSDSAATSDTGNFSIIAFIKRAMQNWTTLLARIPSLVSGRIPVDGSGVTQPVSIAANVNTFQLNSLIITQFSSVSVAYPTTTQEVYTYLNGASLVATVTVTYTDATKNLISSVVRT